MKKSTSAPRRADQSLNATSAENLNAEIQKRIHKFVHQFTTPRLGVNFWVLTNTKKFLTAVPENILYQTAPTKGLSEDQLSLLRLAVSYWGIEASPILEKHLEHPAPPYTKIAGRNDDCWVSSDDPEMIYYVSGIDFYECECGSFDKEDQTSICGKNAGYMSWTKVPTRLLLDYIRDCQAASHQYDRWKVELPSDFQMRDVWELPGNFEWPRPGYYREAITNGEEFTVDGVSLGGSEHIGLKRKPTRSLVHSPTCLQLIELDQHYGPNDSRSAKSIVTISCDVYNCYVANLCGWPSNLPTDALIYLFLDKLIELTPKQFVRYLAIPNWRNDLPVYDWYQNADEFANL